MITDGGNIIDLEPMLQCSGRMTGHKGNFLTGD